MSTALAAALLEKLAVQPQAARRLRRIREDCLKLADGDAKAFARVVQAARQEHPRAVHRALRSATDIPRQVFEHAHTVYATCRIIKPRVKPQFHSDLRCAMALAIASAESAKTLIQANLAWRRRLETSVHSK